MQKKHILLFILATLTLSGFGCQKNSQNKQYLNDSLVLKQEERDQIQQQVIKEDEQKMIIDSNFLEQLKNISQYQLAGPLLDVSGSKASGVVQATFNDNTYVLIATFRGLEEPPKEHYYQGWIVKKDSLDIISTGRVEKKQGMYTNLYSSHADLSDHRIYLLTLEKEGEDQKPNNHILEGTLKPIQEVLQ